MSLKGADWLDERSLKSGRLELKSAGELNDPGDDCAPTNADCDAELKADGGFGLPNAPAADPGAPKF